MLSSPHPANRNAHRHVTCTVAACALRTHRANSLVDRLEALRGVDTLEKKAQNIVLATGRRR
eukprot:6780888-Prymnesium_polylepis.1